VPLPRDLPATIQTFNASCAYEVCIEINIPWASDPSVTFPVLIAHSVDDTNFLPPMQFNQCAYRVLQQTPEYYYMPPPAPVYACHPVQCGPPPGAPMYHPQPPLFNYMPPQNAWAGPIHGQQQQAPMQWGAGAPMQQTADMHPPPPPPPLGAYGADHSQPPQTRPPPPPRDQSAAVSAQQQQPHQSGPESQPYS
jgi:hypothetical protein